MLSDLGNLLKKLVGKHHREAPSPPENKPAPHVRKVPSDPPAKDVSEIKEPAENKRKKVRETIQHPSETKPPQTKKRSRNKHGIKKIDVEEDLLKVFETEISDDPVIPPPKPRKNRHSAASGDTPNFNSNEKKSAAKAYRKNKNGIKILNSSHDLSDMFSEEPFYSDDPPDFQEPVQKMEDIPQPEEDFRKLLDESLFGKSKKKMMAEKDSDYQAPRVIPVSQKIKRYPAPQKDLDLHGFTASDARSKLEGFLKKEQVKGSLTVRVIVGKGLHSQGGAVLPDVAEDTIIELQSEGIVLAHRWENKKKSKSGAVIVYLA